jgi:phospholipase D1/2
LKRRIRTLRDDLLAEHLGCEPARFSKAFEDASGSLIDAIESLCGEGRTLRPFEPPDFGVGDALAENDLLDPERAARAFPRLRRWAGRLRHPLAGSPRRAA